MAVECHFFKDKVQYFPFFPLARPSLLSASVGFHNLSLGSGQCVMDRLYLFTAGCLLCAYDSFWGIMYSWLGIGCIQEVIINVSQ